MTSVKLKNTPIANGHYYPINQAISWLHKMIRGMIEVRRVSADKVMVKLDQASGYGKQTQDTEFWKMDGSRSITAREKM